LAQAVGELGEVALEVGEIEHGAIAGDPANVSAGGQQGRRFRRSLGSLDAGALTMAKEEPSDLRSADADEPAKVEIYTERFGGASIRAKGLLDNKGVSYSEYIIDNDLINKGMMLKRAQGRSEVPQIFVDNRPIGGWEALRDLEARGVLDRLLRLPSPDPDA
jgi:glutaredoxin 3